MRISPYLHFNGQCDEAFALYEKVLGGKIQQRHTFGNSPMASQFGADWADKVMHITMDFGDQRLMGSDAPPQHAGTPQGFRVCLEFAERDEAERVYQGLSESGQIVMAFQETFWSQGFAMFEDRFGTPWMINVPKPM